MTIQEMIAKKNELGLTYEQIAQLSGVPVGTVQKVLGGITKSPRYDTLIALSEVLGDNNRSGFLSENESVYGADKKHGSDSDYSLTGADDTLTSSALAAAIKSSKIPGEFTIEDYYALPDDQRVELIDGVFYDMGAPYTTHQIVVGNLYYQIKQYILANNGPCIPLLSACDVQLDMDDKTMVQPDFMIVCDKDKIVKRKVYGAPDFIVEVLSSSTKKKDMSLKLAKYEAAGVKEYWIVDPDKQKILVYNFDNDFDVAIYGFNDEVPVGLYNGECKVDFKPILEEIRFLM